MTNDLLFRCKTIRNIMISCLLLAIGLLMHSQTFASTTLYSDDFESGMGNWSNVSSGDNKNWTRDSGGTSSSSTGPSTGAGGSTYYMYLETSYGSAYYAGDSAILEGPAISGSGIQLSFDYHMYGSNMGTLAVDVLSGGSWVNGVWSISGQQHSYYSSPYTSVDVDLSAYAVTRIRFRATAAGGYRGDMAIDNVVITSAPTGPVAPEFLSDPVEKSEARQNQPYNDSIADDAQDANGDALSFSLVSGPDWLDVASDGTLSGTPLAEHVGDNSFVVEVSDGALSSTATLTIFVADENTPIMISETDFENGMGDWHNVSIGDNKNWTLDSGGTPSYNTGPVSGAEGSTYYVYLETSSGSAYYAGDSAILEGPEIAAENVELRFQYHMYGSNIGTLHVDVLSSGSWINSVWSLSGQQHTSGSAVYSDALVNLGEYDVSRIRFRAVAAGGYMGDMAIDNIEILSVNPASVDSDGDGVPDVDDLCPNTPASEPADADGCSASQRDTDGDGYPDSTDAFPADPTEWVDSDSDGTGDNADTDDDNDGVADAEDAFPLDSAEWLDTDSDGTGNNADTDDDGDSVLDVDDAYPLISLGGLPDTNGNGVPDDCDAACIALGMLADDDDDGDGVPDIDDAFPLDASESVDSDGDGIGNNADTDDDNDSVLDIDDTYPLISLGGLPDTDGNGVPNDCDAACMALGMTADNDDDGDGVLDPDDAFPLDAGESVDSDGDGVGNNADLDDDNDGMPDAFENLHDGLDPLVDDADGDLDGDGVSNLDEYLAGTNPSGTELIAYTISGLDRLYEIELYSGQTSYIGPLDPNTTFTVSGCAMSPLGVLYVVDGYNDALYTVNKATGDATKIADLSRNVTNVGLSFDNQGALWMVDNDARLYTVNTTSGAVTDIGYHGIAEIDALAWDGSTLYGIASNSRNELYALDRSTAAATLVGGLVNIDITSASGLTFQANGQLWGIERWGSIFTVDAQTGEATLRSSFDNPATYSFNCLALPFDTDADGMPDGWETLYGLDPQDHADAMLDGDSDTLTNVEEYLHGSSPLLADTDADGTTDPGDEFPTDANEWVDSDGDGIGNNADPNDDNDMFIDAGDPFPLDASKPQFVKVVLQDIAGVSDTSMFSISVDGLGDVNADGHDDFIVGRKNGEYTKVYSGVDGSVLHDLTGPAYSNFGEVVASIGDINNDLVNDFAVGAPLTNQVFVYSGIDGSTLFTFSGDGRYGGTLSPAGDVNNDSVPDILIGAEDDSLGGTRTRAGSAQVRSGVDGSVIHAINGSNTNGHLGEAVSDMGDVNGDGYDDFAIKTYSSSTSNRVVVTLYSGQSGSVLRRIDGYYGRSFGMYLENMGDVDQDSVNDLAVGHPEGGTADHGYVQIWSGQTMDPLSNAKYGEPYSNSSYTIANVGDFNADGINDFLMSLHGENDGEAWLVSGSDNITLYEFLPTQADTGYGYGLGLAGDVNNDGRDDFVIGASGSGRVEVVSLLLDSDADGVADDDDAFPLDDTQQ